jgi:3-deoxy-D-manno-octulosonic-acid transferase
MYFIYNLLYTLTFILVSPYLFLRGLIGGHGILQRLGKISIDKKSSHPLIWFHASSVGEVKALAAILSKLKKIKPDLSVAVSVMTKTGKKQAQESLPQADFLFYIPLDFPFILRRVLSKLKPSFLVLVETELWPNLIHQAKNYGCKLSLINGRISRKSFKRYLKLKSFFGLVLSHFDQFLMQSAEDAQRLWDLGGDKGKTKIVGNLKFDRALLGINGWNKAFLRKNLGLSEEDKLVIAGSTHPEEERMVLSVFRRLKEQHKGLILLLAPRHLSRIREIEELLSEFRFSFVRKSSKRKDKEFEVILLDTMGELENLYSLCELAFVGGSLVPTGGHNILEPATYGIPVLYGPHVDNFKTASDLLLKSGGGIMVKDQEELYLEMSLLLQDKNMREGMGKKGKEALLSQAGTSDKTVRFLLELLSRDKTETGEDEKK